MIAAQNNGHTRGITPSAQPAPRAAEAVSAGPQSTGWLANLSFLVDRGSAEQFLAAADALRKEHPHLELRVNGPLPPYSFVDIPASQQAEGGAAETFGAAAAQPTNG